MKINIDYPIESEFNEFKTSLAELDKGIETIAAMLNKHSKANVYFGVSNNGDVIGINGQIGPEIIKKVETRISEIIRPTIIPTIVLEDYDGKKVIHVSAKGNRKPYSSSGNYRIRVGSENKKIDPELLGELFFDSESSSLESVECINQNLSFNTLKYFYLKNNLTINEESFLYNAGLKTSEKFNMLANLLADENDVSIKVVRFSGKDKTKMLSRNEYGYKCLIASMQEANDYVISLNETKVDLEAGIARRETKLFDTHAFEEAWTNACLHNKWVRNVPPAIYIFDDRIEIVSCGGLPFNYTKEDFYRGISRPVNNGLFKIMGQLKLIEQTGHGNITIIDKYGKEAFDISDNFIIVTIPFAFVPSMKHIEVNGLSTSQAKILNIIKDHPSLSIKEISTLANLSISSVNNVIKYLKEIGKIERIGARKNGYYIAK